MQYLVVMTTHVPDGTPAKQVDDVREREAARSRALAAEAHLLRLWRPPLQPGEWRSLGLFAADDVDELGRILASMPLRVWRTDKVTPLSRHRSDPDAQPGRGGTEFLATLTTTVPPGTPSEEAAEAEAREAIHAKELASRGRLERLWVLPGDGRALGLYRAADAAELQTIMDSLPLRDWLTIDVTPLTEHPSDPALDRRESR
jgi:muconolactone delta-isomerase